MDWNSTKGPLSEYHSLIKDKYILSLVMKHVPTVMFKGSPKVSLIQEWSDGQ